MRKSLSYLILLLVMLPTSLFAADLATNITFNSIPNGIHWLATDRYESVSVNGVEIPVIDGVNPNGDKDRLDYDFTTFSASKGKATIRIKAKSPINSIQVSPIKLDIPLTKIDDYTYEFDVPDPTDEEPFYLIATINNRRLAITRDLEETDVPVPGEEGVFNVVDELQALSVDATIMSNVQEVAQAFQNAMDKASAYGTANDTKGVVFVPAGLYYMGNLWLKSNTAFYLERGSVIRFTDNKEDYTDDFIKTSMWSDDPVGRHGTWWICTEEGADNIKIYGRGTIDGNGYYLQKRASRDRLFCNNLLMIMQASNVEVDGIVLFQGAFWGTIVARSNNIKFTNIKFFQSMDGNENDGIDVCESQNVIVDRAIGISLDDPFSTKTWAGTGMMINWFGEPEVLDNVVFNHCISLTYCGAFKLGHGAMQHQNNVVVQNSVVVSAGRAIGIEPEYGNPSGEPVGGFSNVLFENIDIEQATGEGWLKIQANTPDVGVPPAEKITLRNINIRNRGSASSLRGYDENNMIEGITFDNITLFGNPRPVSSLNELNITVTGFYKDLVFVQDYSRDENYHIEAEYFNTSSGATLTDNTSGVNQDTEYPTGYILTNLRSGSYLRYNEVDLGSNTERIRLRTNIVRDNVTVEVRVDNPQSGEIIGTAVLKKDEDTGAWSDQYVDLECLEKNVFGKQDLYIVFTNPLPLALGSINFLELQGRSFADIEGIGSAKETIEVSLFGETLLEVVYIPENTHERELVWTIINESEEGVIGLTQEGVVDGRKIGTATVRATSLYDESIFTDFEVQVVSGKWQTFRLEAESVDFLCDTYHYDSPISIGSVNDPDEEDAEGLSSCWHTNFAVYKDVDFGVETVRAYIRKGYPRGSKMELWIDRTIDESAKTATGGQLIGSIEFPEIATDWYRWETFTTEITGASGIHDLCLVFLVGGGSAENQNYGSLNWIDFVYTDEITNISSESISSSEVHLYPTFSSSNVYIESESQLISSIAIIDLSGRIVNQSVAVNAYNSVVDIETLPQGIYFVEVKLSDATQVFKIQKN